MFTLLQWKPLSNEEVDTRIRGYSFTTYPRIHLVNIFKIIVTAYPRILLSTSTYT